MGVNPGPNPGWEVFGHHDSRGVAKTGLRRKKKLIMMCKRQRFVTGIVRHRPEVVFALWKMGAVA
jgi:hypothetical protein